ncbi:Vacuolar sorting protein 39/Transforming growth factor beta receptor-associated domain 1 [Penicillium riverlandense]|uniref:Vacuolar sorting protein 39/Transforming growth factor beta receptor-associated domain 1 n=1 Tax=Penicillium riverlandense TaxID=1903569 RepID=UPI0025472B97|nr:Vacuolar sorting protein 39/Transforming growth factor beta receptor-associated domain 1 [Penicillium riverlandense]KAJ5812442.1 Vacuolar sorting protein 39/Transforming growth factor beta receptor-associated domain 1 [Penicillium riverlandense]
MLSAFTARPLVELKPRDKSQITAVLAHGDRLLAGLSNGSLRIYRLNDDQSTDLLREEDKFARYKIDQLALVKEAEVLVSLAGGYVALHDAQSYELQEQLAQTKGAGTFAITSNVVTDSDDIPVIISRMAVAVKRKIMLWVWRDMELETHVSELSLASGIKTLTWVSGTRMVVGLTSGFVLVDVESGEVTELAGPGSIEEPGRFTGVGAASMSYIGIGGMVPRPLATRLCDGEILLAKDIHTHFIDVDGQSLGRRQIPWSHAPAELGYSYPFLLALHDASKGVLEVRNPETLTLLQSIPLSAAKILHIPQPNISLAHAGKGFLVASDRTIWRMEALSYDTQIDSLIENGYLDEAISLLDMLEDALLRDKPGRLRAAKLEKAQSLFAAHKYRDALDLFTEVSAPPETVIRLYPRVIAGELSAVESDGTASQDGSEAAAGGAPYAGSVISFLRKTDESSESGSIREDKTLKSAVRELQGYLADVRRRFQRFLNPDGSLKDRPTPGDEASDSVLKLLDFPDDFETAINSKARLVDTTLFRAHMFATPSLAGSLFRIANFCDPAVVMERLEETERYNDLIDFLYGKKLHRQALELLQRFGQSDSDSIPDVLRGPTRTVAYLQNLSGDHVDLVLEFGEWPTRTNHELGMEIFLADTENAETLPRHQVLEFLENIDSSLAVQYLEHIIEEWNDMTPDLHQRLLILYLDRLSEGEVQKKFLAMLRDSEQYSPAKMLDRLDRDSKLFSSEWSHNHLTAVDPDLYEARAIVFSKMGQHRQALEIYVFQLEDHEKAEEYIILNSSGNHILICLRYCNRVHRSEPAEEEIYLTLLSLYLSPPHGYKQQHVPALSLLAKHGSRLPADAALSLIPATLPVQELEFYFKGRMRAVNSVFNEARIVANLRKSRDMQTQAQLLLGEGVRGGGTRARHVTITEERICGVCHKRLGGSVINVFPDNTVVHLGCANRVGRSE